MELLPVRAVKTSCTGSELAAQGSLNMGFEYGGILGLIILALDIWAILRVVQSGVSTGAKVIWILVILVLPVIGLIIWLLAGPK
jgi:hypothetical protein